MASESSKRPKRRLKNAETVRERAIKAQEQSAQPGRSNRLLSTTAAVAGKPARGVGRIFHHQPFKFIGAILRFIGRFPLLRYLASSWRELKVVTWPNRKQTRQLTWAVLLFAIVFGALVSAVDYGLDKLFKAVLLK